MRYIIVEDEQIIASRLQRIISELRPDYTCLSIIPGVEEAIEKLPRCDYDLLFMDIELSDGNCFEIFEGLSVESPVIFTTAYDDYTLQAFKVNSVDYLLKPVKREELEHALTKFEHHLIKKEIPIAKISESFAIKSRPKRRLLVSVGNTFQSVKIEDIVYFESDGRYASISLSSGKSYLISKTLKQLEAELDETLFMRVSRNYIINIDFIDEIQRDASGRIKVLMKSKPPVPVLISQANRDNFLSWVEG